MLVSSILTLIWGCADGKVEGSHTGGVSDADTDTDTDADTDTDTDTDTDSDTDLPLDVDGDGFTVVVDCDDHNDTVFPGAPESCGDALDSDCSGDRNDPGSAGCVFLYADVDGDGFGTGGPSCLCEPDGDYTAEVDGDCAPVDASAFPGQTVFFGAPRSDGSYDFDCDGTEEPAAPAPVECRPMNVYGQCGDSTGVAETAGWRDGVPGCGETGEWAEVCSSYDVGGYYACEGSRELSEPAVQGCR